jgi:isocitrate dehydrogenase kinase/phosphatase
MTADPGRARAGAAPQVAAALLEGLDRHYELFRQTSSRAKERFDDGDWTGVQRAVAERVRFYDERVRETLERLRAEFGAETLGDEAWRQVKMHYIGLLVDHKRPELAETFFNSVSTLALGCTYVDNDLIFVRSVISTEQILSDPPVYRSYHPAEGGMRDSLLQAFRDFDWSRPFADLEREVEHVARALHEQMAGVEPQQEPNQVLQVLTSAFYRNKAAYVIGKVVVNGYIETPFVVPVLHGDNGRLTLDTVLLDSDQISVLFSLSRAYFMVDMDVPSGYVDFLTTIMPTRPRSDLYTALGLGKQGKTLFVRDLRRHLLHSHDLFVEAPGTRGQIMHVFNLPSYPFVFKVIKDVFGPTKQTDHETVKRKFSMVKDVDRVGRMADTIEFTNLALPLARFGRELLQQLQELAPSAIELDGDKLIVKHCYVERRMIPLDLHLQHATPAELEHAVREYGNAIRELAIANVFTGDLLWRNFGINRQGRVVFYDYDEIEYLTDCVFRRIPVPPNLEAEMSDEVWYGVGPHDIFPEEFEVFLLGNRRVREAFLRHHAELLEPEFWQECQRRVTAGEIVEFFPYPEAIRFGHGREQAAEHESWRLEASAR